MTTKQPMPTADLDSLLDHARWVEGFARALVREDSEDVAQDAWLAAIRHPPAPSASPRPWFATVMRNLRRMRFRNTERRRAREDASAPEEKAPTPAELAHRMELQRRLASAVLALEEPQRSTVVLVFYEGLTPADVARRHNLPATTVRSRLRAALATLRERLDAEEGGDRNRWHLALAPIAVVVPKATAPVWPLVFAAVAVVAAVATTGAVVTRSHDAEIRHESTSTPPAHALAPPPSPSPPPPRTAAQLLTVAAPPEVPPAFATAERTLMHHVDECYEIAHRVGRDLTGIVQMTISLDTAADDAHVEIDTARTTITDPDFLECIRENATAIEDQLDRLREQGEPIEGPIAIHVAREMPPKPDAAELVQLGPPDDESPACPEGTALAGTRGTHQWCALPDGTKHGPVWEWDAEGRAIARASYDHGASAMETSAGPPHR
ncbi:MAG: RNA polymerase sigma factor [Deltaproteobacteria bacterium]|nr:RNA polymerase sigma factor [Deltaproteobacteria bacterium]